ncbi:MAG: hypothetical protein S4CHLAM45_11150 [Chlamydiales bacterium]|nr:hypothetical protein [Chlamydiales bacterium]MCH9619607.1 hypothetical protein [Chlamydiales bacterium]MCH9623213.1 hypothetical protein [Chlamydiales bacterium]
MARLTTLLKETFLGKEEKKTDTALSIFSNDFRMNEIGEKERSEISHILEKYATEESSVTEDFKTLVGITQEVKAITNQAAVLHGERIKQVQTLLKEYKDGAFTSWLKATYGNRQTPYNLLQYHEFYETMPKTLHPQIEAMPRQAIYTLASRKGDSEKKEEIVRNYNGETKQEMITKIRSEFPLNENDKRKADVGEGVVKTLNRLIETVSTSTLTDKQSKLISKQLTTLKGLLK